MATKCGLTSPSGAKCIMTIPGHVDCIDGNGGSWPNAANITRATATLNNGMDRRTPHQKKQDIKKAIRKMKPEERAGDISTGVPAEAVASWTSTPAGRAWIDRAYQELVALSQRMAEFTTPEHLWPLLDAPREKRALSQAVQRALRNRIIEEVGARRLREVYHSRDGVPFAMNKLVPIYARPGRLAADG